MKKGFTIEKQNFHNISLGQGQEPVAEDAIEISSRMGHWVMLQVNMPFSINNSETYNYVIFMLFTFGRMFILYKNGYRPWIKKWKRLFCIHMIAIEYSLVPNQLLIRNIILFLKYDLFIPF